VISPAPALRLPLLNAFLATASTKKRLHGQTYAQNPCCGAARKCIRTFHCYETHSDRKWLIYIASLNCGFFGQFSRGLDLQGLGLHRRDLSTKLSTENLKICKASLNQALSPAFASAFAEVAPAFHLA
jgi:hypothetical protein